MTPRFTIRGEARSVDRMLRMLAKFEPVARVVYYNGESPINNT